MTGDTLRRNSRAVLILLVLTGVLAWIAAAITYYRRGEVEWTAIFAGLFVLALAASARRGRGAGSQHRMP